MSDSTDDPACPRARRPDRHRPRPRRLRHRAARRHAAGHARHPPRHRRRASTSTQLSLATRLISRELDDADPMPGQYTLEVTSPGVERSLRTPAHFQREIGKTSASGSPTSKPTSAGWRACWSPPTTHGHDRRRRAAPSPSTSDRHRRASTVPGPCSCGARNPSRASRRPKPASATRAAKQRRVRTPARTKCPANRSPDPRRSHREQSRHERSDPPARPGEEPVGGRPAARARRRAGHRLQAPARRRRRGRRRGQPRDDGVHVHRLRRRRGRQLGQRARRHARRRKSSAASPPRRSAR